MENPNVQNTVENPEEQQQQAPGVIETPQEKVEEKLYAGRFKTPEELETGYKESSQEGVRLAQEVRRLTSQLQQAQTPRQKEAIQDKIEDLTKYFDSDTAKVLNSWGANLVKTALDNYTQVSRSQNEFQSQVTKIWEETKKIYPDVADPKSRLYQRANEILFERRLAQADANGTVQLLTPYAYRIAVEAASEELSRQAPEDAMTRTKKSQVNAIQGRGSKTVTGGKLTYEQYMKLSDDERDAYDQATMKK